MNNSEKEFLNILVRESKIVLQEYDFKPHLFNLTSDINRYQKNNNLDTDKLTFRAAYVSTIVSKNIQILFSHIFSLESNGVRHSQTFNNIQNLTIEETGGFLFPKEFDENTMRIFEGQINDTQVYLLNSYKNDRNKSNEIIGESYYYEAFYLFLELILRHVMNVIATKKSNIYMKLKTTFNNADRFSINKTSLEYSDLMYPIIDDFLSLHAPDMISSLL